jgi:hypothetical protein
MSGAEATLLTFVFTITPAYLAYFVGVANDFALALLLAYLALPAPDGFARHTSRNSIRVQ